MSIVKNLIDYKKLNYLDKGNIPSCISVSKMKEVEELRQKKTFFHSYTNILSFIHTFIEITYANDQT